MLTLIKLLGFYIYIHTDPKDGGCMYLQNNAKLPLYTQCTQPRAG
jgi:hypothetical protein